MGERNCPPLPRAHGGEADVSLTGDVRELRHHEPVVCIVNDVVPSTLELQDRPGMMLAIRCLVTISKSS